MKWEVLTDAPSAVVEVWVRSLELLRSGEKFNESIITASRVAGFVEATVLGDLLSFRNNCRSGARV